MYHEYWIWFYLELDDNYSMEKSHAAVDKVIRN